MYEDVIHAVAEALRPAQCLRDVARYWQFRCTVPGPALRAASEFICQRHRDHGVEARVIPYPADDRTESLDRRRSPLTWVPRSGRLLLPTPDGSWQILCDYAEEPLCLASNSTATPSGGAVAPLVAVPQADRDEGYAGLEVAGKILLVDRPAMNVDAQARKRGALGIISDAVAPAWLAQYPPVRVAADAPELTLWSILSGRRSPTGLWGFNLTPRQGACLRQRLAEADGQLLVRAVVDAELAEGSSEVVEAVLPGTDLAHEEVWVLAHSSEPGARDNASGCCLGVELARVLRALTADGRLPPLRRTVRFLNAVEVDGYLPYLHERQGALKQVVAGLCLDSVGMDSGKAGGALLVFRSPETDASFVDGLMEELCDTVAALPAARLGGDPYEVFAWDTAPYWGNDAFISEGFFDAPAPQISCWPDRYYHSSLDTVAQMSLGALARAGAIAGAYLYLLATAGAAEAASFAGLAARDWKRRIVEAMAQPSVSDQTGSVPGLARHLGLQAADAVVQVLHLAPEDRPLRTRVTSLAESLRRFARSEGEAALAWSASTAGRPPETAPPVVDGSTDHRVYRRRFWHRPADGTLSAAGQERLTALREKAGGVDRAWDWLNGRRSVAEVGERLQWGGAVPAPVLSAYLEVLAAEGLLAEEGAPFGPAAG